MMENLKKFSILCAPAIAASIALAPMTGDALAFDKQTVEEIRSHVSKGAGQTATPAEKKRNLGDAARAAFAPAKTSGNEAKATTAEAVAPKPVAVAPETKAQTAPPAEKAAEETKAKPAETVQKTPEQPTKAAEAPAKPEVPKALAPTGNPDVLIMTGTVGPIPGEPATQAPAIPGMTLVESINAALEANRQLKSAEKNIKLADIKIREAAAKYEPNLSIQSVMTRMDQKTVIAFGPMNVVMADNVVQSHTASLSKALYTSNKVEYAKAMASRYKEAAIFAVDSAKVNLIYNVKKSFYDMLLAKEFVKVAAESVDLMKAHVQTVRNRFNAGTASKFDLLRAEVQEANIKPNLIKAVHGLTISKNVFNNVLARPIFYEIEISGKLFKSDLPVFDIDNAVNTALATRQDMAAAKADLEASEYALRLARAGDKPNVALAGTYDKSKGKAMPVDAFNETWNMSVVAQIPIYDGKQTKHAVETAKETIEQKKINLEQLAEGIKLEVKIAHQKLIQADELFMASEKNVEQAKEALAIAQVSYDNGLNTNLEIMDAQLALTQAKTNYYQALHDYMVSYSELEKSMGIGRVAE